MERAAQLPGPIGPRRGSRPGRLAFFGGSRHQDGDQGRYLRGHVTAHHARVGSPAGRSAFTGRVTTVRSEHGC